MTNPKGMDEFYLRKELKDVVDWVESDWVERMELVVEVQNYDEVIFF